MNEAITLHVHRREIVAILGISGCGKTTLLRAVHAIADRAVMLHDGRIQAAGTVAELDASDQPDVWQFMHRRVLAQEGG